MIGLRGPEILKKYSQTWILLLAFLAMQAAGCITIKRRTDVKKQDIRPQLESSEEELLAMYNRQVQAVKTLQATVDLIPTTGTTYSGAIEEYHDVSGFIIAQRPDTVRVIGQAPVVAKDIFDMVSNGKEFRIYIPSKNSFLVGSTALRRPSNKPLENLRPQHVVEALFWPELSPSSDVLFEQFDFNVSRYYILTLLRHAEGGKLEIARKVWYSRIDLRVSRVQLFGAGGKLDSDITYSDWEPVPGPGGAPATDQTSFARDIYIWRPQDDYKLEIKISKLTLNEPISPDRFELAQPAGTDLIHVGDESSAKQTSPRPGSQKTSEQESELGSQLGSQQ
jgi:outer membrane lipoprotein-sorting protein